MTKERFLYGEIKVRPFISTLALKYISVAIFCLYQIAMCLRLNLAYNQIDDFQTEEAIIDGFLKVITEVGQIGLPLVLIWIVSLINGFEDRAFKMVLFYGIIATLFYIGEIISIKFYVVPKINEIMNNHVQFELEEDLILEIIAHFSNFNVFLDVPLFLYLLFCCIETKKNQDKKRNDHFPSLCHSSSCLYHYCLCYQWLIEQWRTQLFKQYLFRLSYSKQRSSALLYVFVGRFVCCIQRENI